MRITLTCTGRDCPLREVAQATAVFHIQQFERELRAGTKLTITVTRRGYISKVTTITIRKGKSPARARPLPDPRAVEADPLPEVVKRHIRGRSDDTNAARRRP